MSKGTPEKMSTVRVVSFIGLRLRLSALLGDGSPLYAHFARALESRDEGDLKLAIDALEASPVAMREKVQNVLVEWLFDHEDASGLADLPAASQALH